MPGTAQFLRPGSIPAPGPVPELKRPEPPPLKVLESLMPPPGSSLKPKPQIEEVVEEDEGLNLDAEDKVWTGVWMKGSILLGSCLGS
jgi:hypothetical protein